MKTTKIDLGKFQDGTQYLWIAYAFVMTGISASFLFGEPIIAWYEYVGYVGLIVSSFALMALASVSFVAKRDNFSIPAFDTETGLDSFYYQIVGFFHSMNFIVAIVLLFFGAFTLNFLLIAFLLFVFGLHFRNLSAWFGTPEHKAIYSRIEAHLQTKKEGKRPPAEKIHIAVDKNENISVQKDQALEKKLRDLYGISFDELDAQSKAFLAMYQKLTPEEKAERQERVLKWLTAPERKTEKLFLLDAKPEDKKTLCDDVLPTNEPTDGDDSNG